MSTSIRYQEAPRMWALESDLTGRPGALLRLGERRVAMADIRDVVRDEVVERDIGGLLAMAGIFLFVAVVFIVGVAEIGWRTRFLLGAGLLFALAVVSLGETLAIGPVRLVRLRVVTGEGDVVFTTTDARDAAALEAAIRSRQQRPR